MWFVKEAEAYSQSQNNEKIPENPKKIGCDRSNLAKP